MIAASRLAALLRQAAAAHGARQFEVTALTLSGTLLSLALLKHWFMVLTLRVARAWSWGLLAR